MYLLQIDQLILRKVCKSKPVTSIQRSHQRSCIDITFIKKTNFSSIILYKNYQFHCMKFQIVKVYCMFIEKFLKPTGI